MERVGIEERCASRAIEIESVSVFFAEANVECDLPITALYNSFRTVRTGKCCTSGRFLRLFRWPVFKKFAVVLVNLLTTRWKNQVNRESCGSSRLHDGDRSVFGKSEGSKRLGISVCASRGSNAVLKNPIDPYSASLSRLPTCLGLSGAARSRSRKTRPG